jgi:hypothetical protein
VAIVSEAAITKDHWHTAFVNVNLEPKTRMDIGMWLSKIHDQLTPSRQGHPYCAYLDAIKVPKFYLGLEAGDQKMLRSVTEPGSGFDWTSKSILALPPRAQDMLSATHLYEMFGFTMAMGVASELGLCQATDLLPSAVTPSEAGTAILASRGKAASIDLDKEINALPSYKPERFAQFAENVRTMLDVAKQPLKNPKKVRINNLGDLVSVASWANEDKRLLRLAQHANLERALSEISAIKRLAKEEKEHEAKKAEEGAKQAMKDLEPIKDLFKAEVPPTWPPPHVAGKRDAKKPRLGLYTDFVTKHGIDKKLIPGIFGKPLSFANLVPFFQELCRQVSSCNLPLYKLTQLTTLQTCSAQLMAR